MTTEAGTPDGHTTHTADELLIAARASRPHRPPPADALATQATGALLIDIRGDDQRRTVCQVVGRARRRWHDRAPEAASRAGR